MDFEEFCESKFGKFAATSLLAGSLLSHPINTQAGSMPITAPAQVKATLDMNKLRAAIARKETGHIKSPEEKRLAIGDHSSAYGYLQVHKIAVDDVNRIYKTTYTHADMFDPAKADDVFNKYLTYWGGRYKAITGKEPTYEVLARFWNGGGPKGLKKRATVAYWQDVKKYLFA